MRRNSHKPESAIQKEILDYLNGLPATVAWKVMSANERGVPDILCCHSGRFIGIEVKKPGGKLTEIQVEQGFKIVHANGAWIRAGSVADVERGIKPEQPMTDPTDKLPQSPYQPDSWADRGRTIRMQAAEIERLRKEIKNGQ